MQFNCTRIFLKCLNILVVSFQDAFRKRCWTFSLKLCNCRYSRQINFNRYSAVPYTDAPMPRSLFRFEMIRSKSIPISKPCVPFFVKQKDQNYENTQPCVPFSPWTLAVQDTRPRVWRRYDICPAFTFIRRLFQPGWDYCYYYYY